MGFGFRFRACRVDLSRLGDSGLQAAHVAGDPGASRQPQTRGDDLEIRVPSLGPYKGILLFGGLDSGPLIFVKPHIEVLNIRNLRPLNLPTHWGSTSPRLYSIL